MTLGDHSVELATGFLWAEGFLRKPEELVSWEEEAGIVRVQVDRSVEAVLHLLETRTVTTGRRKGTTFYRSMDALRCRNLGFGTTFTPGAVLRRIAELQRRSDLYRQTGGTHNASLGSEAKRRPCCFAPISAAIMPWTCWGGAFFWTGWT